MLVSIDSLRPDPLGTYGYARPTSPEIDRIAANPEPPTFANTIAAMERSGRTLDRVMPGTPPWQRRSGEGLT